jgi:alpha-L-fucosidase
MSKLGIYLFRASIVVLLLALPMSLKHPAARGAEPLVEAQRWVERLTSKNVVERWQALEALGERPVKYPQLVPPLLQALADPDAEVRWRSEFVLGRMGPEIEPTLRQGLDLREPEIRRGAAFALAGLGAKDVMVVSALQGALKEKDALTRCWATRALGQSAEDRYTASDLGRALSDPEADVRRSAVVALTQIGPRAAAAVPALVKLLDDNDRSLRWRAALALGQIGPAAKAAAPALVAALKDGDEDVRLRAAQALARIGPDGVTALTVGLKDPDAGLRRRAAELLAQFGDSGEGAPASKPTAAADPMAAERARWFNEAKFGLLVHWGLYAVPARAKVGQLADWVMDNEKIPAPEYEKFAAAFTAERFNADRWVDLARDTGMRYLVLKAKHHDGFCLWDSPSEPYNSARFGAAKRDIVKELSEACEKGNVKFCAGYSLLDWHNPDFKANHPKYVEQAHAQIKELLTKYRVWGMWFDGEWTHSKGQWHGDELVSMIRRVRPQAVVNDRLGRETCGRMEGVDFYTKEQVIPPEQPDSWPGAWETCQTFGYSWGYSESPDPLKSGEKVLLQLVEVASKGGNFLLNIGPRPDGKIPDPVLERMKVIGAWMKTNGESIYGTQRSPFDGPLPAGRVTAKGNRLYVFLEQWPKDGILLKGLTNQVKRAWLLDGGAELAVTARDTFPLVTVPLRLPDPAVSVVAIELDGPPVVKK